MRPAESHYIELTAEVPYERAVINFKLDAFRSIDPNGILTEALLNRDAGKHNQYKSYSFANGSSQSYWQIMMSDIGDPYINLLSGLMGLLREIMDLGIPAAIQASLISISNMFVSRYINSFGSDAMAGIGAAKKIDKFVGMVAQSVGQAIATFISQNFGAKRLDRAFKSIRVALLFDCAYILAIGSIIYINAEFFVRIFTTDEAAILFGIDMIHTMMPLYVMQCLNQTFANVVRGFGKSRVVMLCSLSGMIVCRQIFLAISMHIDWNVRNIYYGYPVGWTCAALFVFVYYYFTIHRKYWGERKAVE
jgi:Na+-driven multidrug efflux pump